MINEYISPTAFLTHHQTYLEKQEATNNLMLGVLLSLAKEEQTPPDVLLLALDDEKYPPLLCLQTPPYGIMIYMEGRVDEMVEQLVYYLKEKGHELPTVIGPKLLSYAFAKAWSAANGIRFEVDMNLRVFRLNSVKFPSSTSGTFRIAKEADISLVTKWIEAFDKEAVGELKEGVAEKMAISKVRNGEIYLWEDKKVQSMAATSRPTVHGITINFVYTPKEARGNGYASNCVAALSQLMLEKEYQFCCLFTDLANPTSNKIYQNIGYQPICDFTKYRFVKEK